ncbi:hypothetical protein PS6_004053 [Mucor atramentarius]
MYQQVTASREQLFGAILDVQNSFQLEKSLVESYHRVTRSNTSMLSTHLRTVPIDVDLKHCRRVVSTTTSKVLEGLVQFLALGITM